MQIYNFNLLFSFTLNSVAAMIHIARPDKRLLTVSKLYLNTGEWVVAGRGLDAILFGASVFVLNRLLFENSSGWIDRWER